MNTKPTARPASGHVMPPDDDFRFLDDRYAVRSTWESDDGCLLFFDPENAHRVFYVHINSLMAAALS
jgi:hypothetical protein